MRRMCENLLFFKLLFLNHCQSTITTFLLIRLFLLEMLNMSIVVPTDNLCKSVTRQLMTTPHTCAVFATLCVFLVYFTFAGKDCRFCDYSMKDCQQYTVDFAIATFADLPEDNGHRNDLKEVIENGTCYASCLYRSLC